MYCLLQVRYRGSVRGTINTDQRPRPVNPNDPRVERTVTTVLAAARQLLLNGGARAVTVDGIATHTGIARTTIYRHWPSRDDLLAATFESLLPELSGPEPGADFHQALAALMAQLVGYAADEYWQRLVPSLLEVARLDQHIADINYRQHSRQFAVVHSTVELGIAQGALDSGTDPTLAALELVGPLLAAALLGEFAIDQALGDHITATFVNAHRPQTQPTDPTPGAP